MILENLESSRATMIREGTTKEQKLARPTIQTKEELELLERIPHKIPNRAKRFSGQSKLKKASTVENLMSNLLKKGNLVEIHEEQVKKNATTKK